MRFALLGSHPDGLDVAQALVASGRHELGPFVGSTKEAEAVRRRGLVVKPAGDLEEVLADPGVDAVIVAGTLGQRPVQLRRALQSERHVLCVYPPDQTPDTAYEAALIQGDTGRVLLPLLGESLHPGVKRVAELAGHQQAPLGALRLVDMERWARETVLLEGHSPEHKPAFPGWDLLRALAGEIAEVSAFAASDRITADEALLLCGRFERGGLFRTSLLPQAPEERLHLALIAASGQAELVFSPAPTFTQSGGGSIPSLPRFWGRVGAGPARLRWRDRAGELHEENWEAWNPWPALVATFESAVLQPRGSPLANPKALPRPTWQDAVRCLELDDAARRSFERRRTSAMEYQQVSEEVGFKGTMTLVGCGLLWGMLFLVILSRWFPWLGWVIVPLLVLFLALQLLRWFVRVDRTQPGPEKHDQQA